jgi:flavin-dependent dehydrogenase
MALKNIFDLIVAGGGPAGTAAAITAARLGKRVLLLEGSRFPRHKVCGEFVSAESVSLLLGLLGDHAERLIDLAPQIHNADLYLDRTRLQVRIDPPARSISRFVLDQALWNAAIEAGVVGRQATAVRSVTQNGSFTVETATGAHSSTAFINAAGRWSTLGKHKAEHGWIGVKAHYEEPEPHPGVQLYFFRGGYCGVQGVGPRSINVSAMVQRGLPTCLDELLRLEPQLLRRSKSWRQTTSVSTTYPLLFRRATPVSGNALNVGDAAAFVDPFVGDGISIALQTGALAARIIGFTDSSARAAERYARAYEQEVVPVLRRAEQLRHVLRAPRAMRWLGIAAMRSQSLSDWTVRTTRAQLRLNLRDAI